jgi:hypothetical protein
MPSVAYLKIKSQVSSDEEKIPFDKGIAQLEDMLS